MRDRRRAILMALGIPALLAYGTLAVAQLRSARAMDRFTRLQKAFPPDSLGKIKMNPEVELKKVEALTLAERLATDNPDIAFQTALMHLVRAETQSLQGELVERDGDSAGPQGRLLTSLQEGLRWINQAIVLNPGVAEYHFVKATLLQNLAGTGDEGADQAEGPGTPEAVSSLLHLADRLDPYRPSLHYRLGSFWLALGEHEAAREAFAWALKDSSRFARPVIDVLWASSAGVEEMRGFFAKDQFARALLAEFLWVQGFKEQAEEEFDAVRGAATIEFRVIELLVSHDFRTGKSERARGLLDRSSRNPEALTSEKRGRHFYLVGQSYLLENRFVEAASSFQSALDTDPQLYYVHQALGRVYAATGDFDRAIARFRFLLEKTSEGLPPRQAAELCVDLAHSYEKKSLYIEALDQYLRASRLDPTNRHAQERAAALGREHL